VDLEVALHVVLLRAPRGAVSSSERSIKDHRANLPLPRAPARSGLLPSETFGSISTVYVWQHQIMQGDVCRNAVNQPWVLLHALLEVVHRCAPLQP